MDCERYHDFGVERWKYNSPKREFLSVEGDFWCWVGGT